MKIQEVQAFPLSFSIPEQHQVTLGIGKTIKRDAVLVKVSTDSGIVGWGEAHAARAPTAMAELINTTLRQLVLGLNPMEPEKLWEHVYRMQIASHGMGTAATIGLSGIDLALWDIRAKAERLPLYELLGGQHQEIAAYAGGVSLGYQEPQKLISEVEALSEWGFAAIKIRVGDSVENDTSRVEALRNHFGDSLGLLVDANTAFSLDDGLALAPVFERCRVEWIEEPFPPQDYARYIALAAKTDIPLAAGENHYTRFDFLRARDDGAITIWQPDLSKTGGLTEALRIARIAHDNGYSICPHTSLTGINMAATIHFLCAINNAGYFEADVSVFNPFKNELCSGSYELSATGTVQPLDVPGIGVDIDESRLSEFPVITGPGYI